MEKIFLLIFIGTLILLPTSVLMAQIIEIENPLEAESFEDLLNAIVNFIFYVGVAIAPIMIMIAAFFFLTAGGDPKRVDTARQIILWTVIGLAIILLAKGLISVLREIIGVSVPKTPPQPPKL